jgi:hypothetical protein
MAEAQSLKNHTRFHAPFHFFVAPVLLINVFVTGTFFIRHYTIYGLTGIWWIVVSLAVLVGAGLARGYALKVQDRVIRVEERLRLASLVTPSELAELDSLSIDQYVGLRFASNPEVPDLARRAVREKLTRKQIKQAIVAWRADDYRV